MQVLLRMLGVTIGLLVSCAGARREEVPTHFSRVRGQVILPSGVLSTDLLALLDTNGEERLSIVVESDGSFASVFDLSKTEQLSLELSDSRARVTTMRNGTAAVATRRTKRSEDGNFDFGFIELPPHTRCVEFEVVDCRGNAVPLAVVQTWSQYLSAPVEVRCDASGRSRILTTYERCSTRVRTPGFRDDEREVLGTAATIVLQPSLAIELRMPRDLPEISSPHELRVRVQQLTWKVDDPSCFAGSGVRFDNSVSVSKQRAAKRGDTWLFELPRTGRYIVTAWIVDTRIDRTRPARTGFQGPCTVGEDGLPGGLELDVDVDKINFARAATVTESD